MLRSLRDAILVLVPLVAAGAASVAYTVLADAPFNLANVIVIPLIFGLGVDNGIHVVARWRETGSLPAAVSSSTFRAILLSGATTLASFSTLMIADNPGIAGMGELLAVSMGLILIASLIVLPALLAFFRPMTPG
jgi:predicted RND superfamily exporter protein